MGDALTSTYLVVVQLPPHMRTPEKLDSQILPDILSAVTSGFARLVLSVKLSELQSFMCLHHSTLVFVDMCLRLYICFCLC